MARRKDDRLEGSIKMPKLIKPISNAERERMAKKEAEKKKSGSKKK